jgi:hypothetical protein
MMGDGSWIMDDGEMMDDCERQMTDDRCDE